MTENVQLPEGLKQITFLYIDDMSFYQSLVQQTLDNVGHVGKKYFASSVNDAVVVINNIYNSGEKIDFIISDFHLPDGTGKDLVTKVRAHPALANLPFIVFSTDDNKANILAAFSAGADEFMFKPIDPETFVAKIVFCWNKRNKNQK